MTVVKNTPLMAHKFVEAMIDAGLLPPTATYVRIEATVGEVVRMTYKALGDHRLLNVAHKLEVAPDEKSAGLAK